MAIANKVTTLITAESIIAGFMIAYGALNGQMLNYWRDQSIHNSTLMASTSPTSLATTTYLAGVGIYAIVITCFASILLLYSSIDTNENDNRYQAGYWLFIIAMLLSCAFVNVAVYSIYHFITNNFEPIDLSTWVNVPAAEYWSVRAFYTYVVSLIIVVVMILTHPNERWHRLSKGRTIALYFFAIVCILVYLRFLFLANP